MIRTIFITAALLLAGPASAQSEPVKNRVEVNGMQLYYEVSGEGEPLIVLHGAYMTIPGMGEIIPMLAETHGMGRGRRSTRDARADHPG